MKIEEQVLSIEQMKHLQEWVLIRLTQVWHTIISQEATSLTNGY